MIIRDEMLVILESLRKLVQWLVCRCVPLMLQKGKGERGENGKSEDKEAAATWGYGDARSRRLEGRIY